MPKRVQTEHAPVVMPDAPGASAWLRNFRLSGFALSMLVLVIVALVVLAPRLKTLVEQREQIAALQQSVADAHKSVDDLNAQVARWNDPAYIEAQARDRLYYVFPGDISYLVIGDDTAPKTADTAPISSEIQPTRVDWVSSLLRSVYTAGLTTATPDKLDATVGGAR